MLSKRVREVGFSPTLAVSDLARRLRAEGRDVLDFSAGQPDFPSPDPVKAAGHRAIDENQTRYTANAGIDELRRAVVDRLRERRGLSYEPSQVLISPGAKASLYFACQSLLDPGDEMLVPVPYWTSYPEQVRLAGATPVFVSCDEADGFKLTASRLEDAVTDRTKAILLNYPSNPTGVCYDREELASLAEVCVRCGLWVIADEIYSEFLYDGRQFTSIARLGPEIADRTLVIDGVSKSHAMTGWRIGYAAGPPELISGMSKLQSHSTSNATSISQWASVGALAMSEADLAPRLEAFAERREEILRRFPNVSRCFRGEVASGEAVAKYLLETADVAVVPGEAFGSAAHVRFSYAASLERVREGMDRVAEALGALAKS